MMAKNKASKRKVAKKKTEAPLTSEQLGFNLNQNYTAMLQAQRTIRQAEANIQAINKELEKRQLANTKNKD
jgi:hypothetical protein